MHRFFSMISHSSHFWAIFLNRIPEFLNFERNSSHWEVGPFSIVNENIRLLKEHAALKTGIYRFVSPQNVFANREKPLKSNTWWSINVKNVINKSYEQSDQDLLTHDSALTLHRLRAKASNQAFRKSWTFDFKDTWFSLTPVSCIRLGLST